MLIETVNPIFFASAAAFFLFFLLNYGVLCTGIRLSKSIRSEPALVGIFVACSLSVVFTTVSYLVLDLAVAISSTVVTSFLAGIIFGAYSTEMA